MKISARLIEMFPRSGWKLILLCLGLAVLISLPALRLGLFVDDYYHLAVMEELTPFGNVWSMFEFAPGDPKVLEPRIRVGPFPWFTLPEMKATFFRPLSCALAAFDHTVFGRRYWVWHLHSILWYLLMVSAWGFLLRKVVPEAVGAVALVIFTLDQAHSFPVAWLANRNALVAVTLALWGLCAHVKWREDGWRWGLPLSMLGYTAGLLGGESALGVLAYLGTYEFFAGHGPLRARIRSLLPAALIGVVYVLLYKSGGYGAYGSGSYIDPVGEPFDYLSTAPGRMLALIAGGLAAFPIDLSLLLPAINPIQASVGLCTALLFGVVLWRTWPDIEVRTRRALRWMIPGALLSLLPVSATFPSMRLLVAASMGESVVLACVLTYWWKRRREGSSGRLLGVFGWFLVAVHLIIPPFAWVAQASVLKSVGVRFERMCMQAEMDGTGREHHYILMTGPDPLVSLYPPIVRAVCQQRRVTAGYSWQTISQALCSHRVTRTAANGLEVEVIGGSMLNTELERLFRSPKRPLALGQEIDLGYMKVTVLELGSAGPSRVGLEFEKPLEDPSLWFLVWKDSGLRKFVPPRIGESVVISFERGLM